MSNPPINQSQGNIEVRVTITPESEHQILLRSVEEGTKNEPKLLKTAAGGRSCSIFRVPQSIVEHHKSTFQPEVVSIGPYYHNHKEYPRLKMMQEHKWRVLGAALVRLKRLNRSYDDFLTAIAVEEKRIRECYSEATDFSSSDLIQMMILDGCFIIELFLVVEKIAVCVKDDPIFALPWILSSIARDLLRLENQIPLFVLQKLYDLSIPASGTFPAFTLLILRFYNNYSMKRQTAIQDKYKNFSGGNHLLDLTRMTYQPSSQSQQETVDAKQKNVLDFIRMMFQQGQRKEATDAKDTFKLIQPVEKLRKAGIECKQSERAESFLDIKFKPHGVLEIPTLPADDFMQSFILNCIAFEQCYKHCSQHFTSYVIFMSCLINTVLDAGYLRDRIIIENYSGTDKEVVKFFNKVSRSISFDVEGTYLKEVFKEMNGYYRKEWHVKWASFRYTYFDTPWTFMSALAALVLLLFTIAQSYVAIYGLVKPQK